MNKGLCTAILGEDFIAGLDLEDYVSTFLASLAAEAYRW